MKQNNSNTIELELREQLLTMAAQDQKLREELLNSQRLFDGYDEELEKLHYEHAQRLEKIIQAKGWPTESMVGVDGARAAWLILQHAIGRPDLLRKCLPLLQQAAQRGEIDAKSPAYLEDRICFFQRQPQKFGTQFDWDEDGNLSPWQIQDLARVDELREKIGLPSLEAQIELMRQKAAKEGEKPPCDWAKRMEEMHRWSRKVGWID
jgi:hypothetical protein